MYKAKKNKSRAAGLPAMRAVFLILAVFIIFQPAPSLSDDLLGTKQQMLKHLSRWKYEVIEFKNGGSLSGKAIFKGDNIPQDETLTLTSEQDLCGDTLPAKKYVINSNKEIKNVIVYLADIRAGRKTPPDPVIIDNIICAFEPLVSVGFLGNVVINRNTDPVLHNFHGYIRKRTTYNIAIPEKGMDVERQMKGLGLMTLRCNPHPWMRAYVYIFNHPYAAVTNEKGEFSIIDIPAGSYEVRAWHEGFGDISLGKAMVKAGNGTRGSVISASARQW